jgi:hypothetical protein
LACILFRVMTPVFGEGGEEFNHRSPGSNGWEAGWALERCWEGERRGWPGFLMECRIISVKTFVYAFSYNVV